MIPADHEGPPDYAEMAKGRDQFEIRGHTVLVPYDSVFWDSVSAAAALCREQASKDSVPTRQELAAAARAATGHTQATHVAAVIEAQMVDRKLATPSRARLVAAWVAEQGGKAK